MEILSLSPGQAVSVYTLVVVVEVISELPSQALKLCQAVHRLHFQLLVLLGSYVKLLHSLESHLTTSGVSHIHLCSCSLSHICVALDRVWRYRKS